MWCPTQWRAPTKPPLRHSTTTNNSLHGGDGEFLVLSTHGLGCLKNEQSCWRINERLSKGMPKKTILSNYKDNIFIPVQLRGHATTHFAFFSSHSRATPTLLPPDIFYVNLRQNLVWYISKKFQSLSAHAYSRTKIKPSIPWRPRDLYQDQQLLPANLVNYTAQQI